MNEFEVQKFRSSIIKLTRQFFESKKFLEVETPILVHSPGFDAYQKYFSTYWQHSVSFDHKYYLRSSPEFHMKRLLADGAEKIFEIAKCFRNGYEYSPWHNPEFTMLEWYEIGADFEDMIEFTHQYIAEINGHLRRANFGSLVIESLTRISVYEAFENFANIKLIDLDPYLVEKAIAQKIGSVNTNDDFETAFFKILIEVIEPKLMELKYCVLFDYPPSQAALASVDRNGYAKRFEFYLDGIELCNGYLEDMSASSIKSRFKGINYRRQTQGLDEIPIDNKFFQALEDYEHSNGPIVSGNALGVDRLTAILSGSTAIDSFIPFRPDFTV